MISQQSFEIFILVLVRVSSFFVVSPFFSMRQIPQLVKLAIILVISYLTSATLPLVNLEMNHFLSFGMSLIQEVMIGLALAYVCHIIFLGISSAGDLIDTFAGVKMASMYDPIAGTNGSLYSNLYNWLALILLLNLNVHHYLIKGLINSFYVLPPTNDNLLSFSLDSIVTLVTTSFMIAIQLALPVGIILFFVDVILGMISRTVPQINVFVLGMPIKLIVSFLVFLLLITGILQSISWALESVISSLDQFIKAMI
ncbi:MAG: flagellar biosynthetic protein FliR [Turicibacter sp.]